MADMKTARVKWVENLKFVGDAPSGHTIALDGPKEAGGDDSAVRRERPDLPISIQPINPKA